MLRQNPYDRAFEAYLREYKRPYVAVNEEKRAILEDDSLKSLDFIVSVASDATRLRQHLLIDIKGRATHRSSTKATSGAKPSIYESNQKGRVQKNRVEVAAISQTSLEFSSSTTSVEAPPPATDGEPITSSQYNSALCSSAKLRQTYSTMNWVTAEDISGLNAWEHQFGSAFTGLLVFAHPYETKPPLLASESGTFFQQKWYQFWGISVQDYALHMVRRSPKWNTYWLRKEAFIKLATPIHHYF